MAANPFRRHSDAEYVGIIDRTERRFRRPAGCLALALATVQLIALGWFWPTFRTFHDAQLHDPIMERHDPVTHDLMSGSYQVGLSFGASLTVFVFVCLGELLLGITLLCGARKSRLLVKYFRAAHDAKNA